MTTHNYMIGIEVVSSVLTRNQITAAVGVTPSHGWDMGDPNHRGQPQAHTSWRLELPTTVQSDLDRPLGELFVRWPVDAARRLRSLDAACAVQIRIAAIHTTVPCTVHIGAEWLRRAADSGLELEMSTYPGSDDADRPD